MKYKLLKETPWIAIDSIIDVIDNDTYITNDKYEQYRNGKDYSSETYDWLTWMIENHPEDFEEVKETQKPKFTIWQYVVCEYADGTKKYLQIHEIAWGWEAGYMYNRYFIDTNLRNPTPEELSIYFS